MKGRAETNSKEYLPFPVLLGSILEMLEREKKKEEGWEKEIQILIPFNEGADADGQYARAIRTVLDRRGYEDVDIVAPVLEKLPEQADDPDLLMEALVNGDLLYAAPAEQRENVFYKELSGWEETLHLASEIGKCRCTGRRLGIVGTPMSITVLNEGILDEMEYRAENLVRNPLSEMMWFLWKDCSSGKKSEAFLKKWRMRLMELHEALMERSSFCHEPEELFTVADRYLPDYAGANGRYRYAKAILLGKRTDAIFQMAPRYENTAMVLNMRGIHENCPVPVYDLSLDGDFDESGWEKLRSFLYYCGKK